MRQFLELLSVQVTLELFGACLTEVKHIENHGEFSGFGKLLLRNFRVHDFVVSSEKLRLLQLL